jgi:hypothetical protein
VALLIKKEKCNCIIKIDRGSVSIFQQCDKCKKRREDILKMFSDIKK